MTAVDELVEWLRAQLDKDERIARAVKDRSAPWDGQWMADGNSAVRTVNGHVLFYRHDSGPLKPGLADHAAEWDPARVLREIDAKRQLLALHQEKQEQGYGSDLCTECGFGEVGQSYYPCATLRLLALPYANRPGSREDWRP